MSAIDITFEAEIHRVGVKPVVKDGHTRRLCKLILAREFDTLLAAGLGGDGRTALRMLEGGAFSEVTIPITAIVASGTFKASLSPYPEVTIPDLRGVKAKAKAGKGEDAPASVKLEFSFDWSEAAWVFLGRNALAHAEVTLKSLQTELKFPPAGKGNGKRPRGAEL